MLSVRTCPYLPACPTPGFLPSRLTLLVPVPREGPLSDTEMGWGLSLALTAGLPPCPGPSYWRLPALPSLGAAARCSPAPSLLPC